MDAAHFDALSAQLARDMSRRHGLGLLAGLGLSGFVVAHEPATARKKRPRKVRLCVNGQTVRVSKRRLKKYPGATLGACPCKTCAAPVEACGSIDDSCGGTLTCGTCQSSERAICDSGVCVSCAGLCPAPCDTCLMLGDGRTRCARSLPIYTCVNPCASDADCGAPYATCVQSWAPAAGLVFSLPAFCGHDAPGECASINVC